MNLKDRNTRLVALLVLVVGASLLWDRLPMLGGSSPLGGVTGGGPGLVCTNLEIPMEELARLGGATAIRRGFVDSSGAWILTAVDGSENRRSVHDPVYCFRGDGWEVEGTESYPLEMGEANLLRLTKGPQSREFAYWFLAGDHAFSSPVEYWARTTLRRITRGLSGPEPILCALHPGPGNPNPNWDLAANQLIPRLFKQEKKP